jgi:phosphate-selective porin
MTMLKTVCSSLKSSNVPLKTIGIKVKFSVSHDSNNQIHLQASNKKRRYQRRGSKTPQMMADLQRKRSDGENNMHSLQQSLLSDSLFLQELLLLDDSEDHDSISQLS